MIQKSFWNVTQIDTLQRGVSLQNELENTLNFFSMHIKVDNTVLI